MSPSYGRVAERDARPRPARPSGRLPAQGVAPNYEAVLRLHASAGNRAVTALLSRRHRDHGTSPGPVLQRATGEDFAVHGIFPDAGKPEHESKIFFDFARHEIPAQEEPKLDKLAVPADRDLVLHGLASSCWR